MVSKLNLVVGVVMSLAVLYSLVAVGATGIHQTMQFENEQVEDARERCDELEGNFHNTVSMVDHRILCDLPDGTDAILAQKSIWWWV